MEGASCEASAPGLQQHDLTKSATRKAKDAVTSLCSTASLLHMRWLLRAISAAVPPFRIYRQGGLKPMKQGRAAMR